MIDPVSVPQHGARAGVTHFRHETSRNGEFRTRTRHHHGVLAQSAVSSDS